MDSCKGCRFYEAIDSKYPMFDGEGHCKIGAPKVYPDIDRAIVTCWPRVSEDKWCGEFSAGKPREKP